MREELELKQGPLEGIKGKNYMTKFIRNPPGRCAQNRYIGAAGQPGGSKIIQATYDGVPGGSSGGGDKWWVSDIF